MANIEEKERQESKAEMLDLYRLGALSRRGWKKKVLPMDHKVEKTKHLDSLHYHLVKPNAVEDCLSENGPGYSKRPEITRLFGCSHYLNRHMQCEHTCDQINGVRRQSF